MYKRRLKNIIWVDPSGIKEFHPVDENGILIEGIKRAQKKNLKARKPVMNFPLGLDIRAKQQQMMNPIPMMMSQTQVRYQNVEKPQIQFASQPRPPQLINCSKFNIQPPQMVQQYSNYNLNKVPELQELNEEASHFPIIENEELDTFSPNFCQSSTDISMLSCNDDYSDIFEISTLYEF